MLKGKFYEDAEKLSETLDKLAEEHNSCFVGTKRHDPITLQDNLDALEFAFRQGQKVIISFAQGMVDTSEAMNELIRTMDRYNLYERHSESIESYNALQKLWRRICHTCGDLAWRAFYWIAERILSA